MDLVEKYNLKRVQFWHAKMQCWYVYSGGVLERIRYSKKANPAQDILIVAMPPDAQKLKKRLKPRNYIANKALLEHFDDSIKLGKPSPELLRAFELMSHRISLMHNFSGYTWLDDMKSHALLNFLEKWDYFNPSQSDAIFSYYTTMITNSFKQIIKLEKRQSVIKDAIAVNSGMSPSWHYDSN